MDSEKLKERIEDLYRIFACYYPPKLTLGDSSNEKWIPVLKTKRLRALASDEVGRYTFSAMTTCGTEEDFKALLPRIFELCASNSKFGANLEIAVGKLAYGNWTHWPEKEQKACFNFCHCWWACAVRERASGDPSELICAMGQIFEDLGPFLKEWVQAFKEGFQEPLLEFVKENAPLLVKRRQIKNSFWARREKQKKQVVDWLLQHRTIEILEASPALQNESYLFAVNALRVASEP